MSPTKSITTLIVAVSTTHIRRLLSSSPSPSSSPVNNKQVNTVDDDDDDDSKKWETPSNQWGLFQTKADFTLDVTVLIIFIVCFILGAFLLNYLSNRFTRITSTTHDDNNNDGERNRASKEIKNRDKFDKASGPTLEFSKRMKMAGTESVCAVCLSEFVEGEGIRVLPKCNHGFHINCIEKWLLNFKTSCPTCRTNCLNSAVPTTKTDFFDDESGGDVESGGAATELAVIRKADHLQEEGSSGSSSSTTAAATTTVAVPIAVAVAEA